MVGDDFNDILYTYEKQGVLPREKDRMEEFHRTLEDCQLGDIGYLGPWFTWERSNVVEINIREGIDIGLATLEWLQLFSDFTLR